MELLASVDFIQLLLNNVFANSASAAQTRIAAAEALAEAVELCGALRRSAGDEAAAAATVHTAQAQVEANALADLPSNVRAEHASAAGEALESMYGSLTTLLQSLVRNVGMPQQRVDIATSSGRHVLRVTLRTLRGICCAVPCEIWAPCAPDCSLVRLPPREGSNCRLSVYLHSLRCHLCRASVAI